ncbi:MAG: DNA polymerase I [Kistimonas sp.]|nr:DNA polymerase I [Kistimonas sp.]
MTELTAPAPLPATTRTTPEQNHKPLVLVDASSYLYRAWHALPPLSTSTGQPTGAVKGVTAMLRRLQQDCPDSTIVVIFDAPGGSFRDTLYTEYKAHRPPMPDDLRAQTAPLHRIIRAMGLPLLIIKGVEADDVIGTLSHQATQAQRPTLISTGDKDMAQLVNSQVTLINTMTNTRLDVAGVQEKFGVTPQQLVDYLALMGDKSDNIPGVPGVGDKTAAALLQELGSLKAVYADTSQVARLKIRGARSLAKKLEDNREQAWLSRDLARIRTDLELDLDLDSLTQKPADKAELLACFEQLEFRNWARDLKESTGATETERESAAQETPAREEPVVSYHTLLEQADFDQWLERLAQAPLFSFDTETTSLDPLDAELVGLSFAIKAGEAAYVPLAHDYPDAPRQLSRTAVLAALKPLLEDDQRLKVGQNLKYDSRVLARYGIQLAGIAFDTMIESYVLDAAGGRHDMDSMAERYLDVRTVHFEELAGRGARQLTFNQIAVDKASFYAAEDADITLRLHQTLWPRLLQQEQLTKVFEKIDLPLVSVLARMEHKGTKVDPDCLKEQSREISEKLDSLEDQAWQKAGRQFNLSSPAQLQAILFDELGLPVRKKTPKGQPSTAEEVLSELAQIYDLPRLILEHRHLSKLRSTYTDKLPLMIRKDTGRIHTSWHQAVTATGRMSSSHPNLQNIPVRTAEGRRIRQAFIAEPGYTLVAADYSQIELRIMAHLSGDSGLLAAFAAGQDIHSTTAAEVFGVADPGAVTTDQRRKAKAINFGLIYGMSAFGLARQLQVPLEEASHFMKLYFSRYPGVQAFMERTRILARQQGYVSTLAGRRLSLPQINARNRMQQQAAERTAINAPLQGTAADILRTAMIEVDRWLQDSGLHAHIVMQVHDELVLEVQQQQLDEVTEGLRQRMESAARLDVPLIVDIGQGDNWHEAH